MHGTVTTGIADAVGEEDMDGVDTAIGDTRRLACSDQATVLDARRTVVITLRSVSVFRRIRAATRHTIQAIVLAISCLLSGVVVTFRVAL